MNLKKVVFISIIVGTLLGFIIGQLYLDREIVNYISISSKINISKTTKIDFIVKQIINNMNENTKIYNDEHLKPTYEYLKSVTVFIAVDTSFYNIEANDIQEARWLGTGVIYKVTDKYTYILTNKHVAPKQQNIRVFVGQKADYENTDTIFTKGLEATVIQTSKKYELSLIRVKGKLDNKYAIKDFGKSVSIQDKVYIVGNPLGDKYTYGEGVVAGTFEDDAGTMPVIQVPTISGNSGSGVFNQKGLLVGLVYACKVYPLLGILPFPLFTHGIFVPANLIKEFVSTIKLE
jgi:S1-C subfamily serine protease